LLPVWDREAALDAVETIGLVVSGFSSPASASS
jgi:hypothetical protein